MSDLFWSALALVLVVEGLLPFFNPQGWRRVFEKALQMTDAQLRLTGLVSMAVGLLMLAFLR